MPDSGLRGSLDAACGVHYLGHRKLVQGTPMSSSISSADPSQQEEVAAGRQKLGAGDTPARASISPAHPPEHEELRSADIFWDDPLELDKQTLTNRKGVRFRDFRRTLMPR